MLRAHACVCVCMCLCVWQAIWRMFFALSFCVFGCWDQLLKKCSVLASFLWVCMCECGFYFVLFYCCFCISFVFVFFFCTLFALLAGATAMELTKIPNKLSKGYKSVASYYMPLYTYEYLCINVGMYISMYMHLLLVGNRQISNIAWRVEHSAARLAWKIRTALEAFWLGAAATAVNVA